jgi:hypothetical protein
MSAPLDEENLKRWLVKHKFEEDKTRKEKFEKDKALKDKKPHLGLGKHGRQRPRGIRQEWSSRSCGFPLL